LAADCVERVIKKFARHDRSEDETQKAVPAASPLIREKLQLRFALSKKTRRIFIRRAS
jgi:hypothetical protein